jgi:hypothetical protein
MVGVCLMFCMKLLAAAGAFRIESAMRAPSDGPSQRERGESVRRTNLGCNQGAQ